MAKRSTTPRPARTPREVRQPKIAAIGAMTPEPTSPPAAGGGEEAAGAEASASAATAGAAAAANAPATSSTHTPEQSDLGGAGIGAGPAAGDHAELAAGILVVTTKRPSRWRAGRQFTKGGETRIPMIELTEDQYRAISEDPVLESRIEPTE